MDATHHMQLSFTIIVLTSFNIVLYEHNKPYLAYIFVRLVLGKRLLILDRINLRYSDFEETK